MESTTTVDDLSHLNANITPTTTTAHINLGQLPSISNYGSTLITGLFWATSATALLGNVLIFMLFLFACQSSAREFRPYQMSICLADITLALFCIPYNFTEYLYGYWSYPVWLCPFSHLVQFTVPFVTLYTLLAQAFDHYREYLFAVRILRIPFNTGLALATIWAAGILFGLEQFAYMKTENDDDLSTDEAVQSYHYHICVSTWPEAAATARTSTTTLLVVHFLIIFILPALALALVNAGTALGVLRHEAAIPAARRALIVDNTFTGLVFFTVCWLPKQLWDMATRPDGLIGAGDVLSTRLFVALSLAIHWLAMVHSVVNAYLYFKTERGYLRHRIGLGRRGSRPPSDVESIAGGAAEGGAAVVEAIELQPIRPQEGEVVAVEMDLPEERQATNRSRPQRPPTPMPAGRRASHREVIVPPNSPRGYRPSGGRRHYTSIESLDSIRLNTTRQVLAFRELERNKIICIYVWNSGITPPLGNIPRRPSVLASCPGRIDVLSALQPPPSELPLKEFVLATASPTKGRRESF